MSHREITPEQFLEEAYRLETEASFQRRVMQLAQARGCMAAHFRAARTKDGWVTPMMGDKGFPDTVIVCQSKLFFFELKSEEGRVRLEQQQWIDGLSRCDKPMAEVLRPRDWERIVKMLT